MSPEIPLSAPSLTGNEAAYLDECIRSGYVSSVGPFVTAFEERFAATVGCRHAVACASGTAALHLALIAVGVGPGDRVAVSDLTFVASANAVRYAGADPVVVDSTPATWNLDTEALHDWWHREAAAGRPLPTAVEPVHVLGHPADLEPLRALADRFGTAIVEDAAEALGARDLRHGDGGRWVGSLGTVGCFSFNGNKIITSGGGGMVTTDDAELARRVRHLSTQAKLPGVGYEHDEVGFNYRMTNLAAAVGLAQLEQLDAFLRRKAEIAAAYDAAFAPHDEVTVPPRPPWAAPSHWLYSVLLPDRDRRDALLGHLRALGIGARPLWSPLARQAPYRGAARIGSGAVAADLSDRGLSLPCSVGLRPDEVDEVAHQVATALGHAG